jgi:esterase/lipase superfamily enzyme
MVTVYFATNRNLTGTAEKPSFGSTFNAHGPHAVRFGWAEVTGDKLEELDINVCDEVLQTASAADQVFGSRELFGQVMRKMAKHSRDTLIYVHGFGFSFEDAIRRSAALKLKYSAGNPINVFAFTWPGDGKMIPFVSYYSDRSDARNSGMAMARTFLFMKDFLGRMRLSDQAFCNQRLHVLAHSMGNYALRHGLQGIRNELSDKIPRIFDNIILAAADEDDDAFELDDKFRKLPRLARRVHIYFSPHDRALLISDKTKRNPDRLGSDGPRLIDDLPRKVVLIDCREVDHAEGDIQVHQYYRLKREVVEDISAVLAGTAPEDIDHREHNTATRTYRIRRRYEGDEGTLPDPTKEVDEKHERERQERERLERDRDRGR